MPSVVAGLVHLGNCCKEEKQCVSNNLGLSVLRGALEYFREKETHFLPSFSARLTTVSDTMLRLYEFLLRAGVNLSSISFSNTSDFTTKPRNGWCKRLGHTSYKTSVRQRRKKKLTIERRLLGLDSELGRHARIKQCRPGRNGESGSLLHRNQARNSGEGANGKVRHRHSPPFLLSWHSQSTAGKQPASKFMPPHNQTNPSPLGFVDERHGHMRPSKIWKN